MRRSILHLKKKAVKKLAWIGLSTITAVFGIFAAYFLLYTGKIYPNIKLADVEIGGLTVNNAATLLSSNVKVPQKIQLIGAGQTFAIDTKDFDLSYDYAGSAQKAFNLTRTGNFFYDLRQRLDNLFYPRNLGLVINLDTGKLDKIISIISGQVSVDPVEPSIKLTDGGITINKGTAGTEIDSKFLRTAIGENLSLAKNEDIQIPINPVDHSLNQSQADELKVRAEKYIGKTIRLKFEYSSYTLTDVDLLRLLATKTGYNSQSIDVVTLDFSTKVKREPQNPKFNFENGRVTEFQPALDGIRLDAENFKNQIITALS
ncbi:MAG: peptidoglycan binding domain-containing protein, partial [Candidatus Woesebacteria bacterium]|nr:peptidoglycan binding domain-containing protein [Candidatus Woesebacteria bacterium]